MAEMRTLEDSRLHRTGVCFLPPASTHSQPATSSFGLLGLTDRPFFMILPFLAKCKLFKLNVLRDSRCLFICSKKRAGGAIKSRWAGNPEAVGKVSRHEETELEGSGTESVTGRHSFQQNNLDQKHCHSMTPFHELTTEQLKELGIYSPLKECNSTTGQRME